MRAFHGGLLALVVLCVVVAPALAGCDYYKSCASCVFDSTCGWCGSDPMVDGARTNSATITYFLDSTNLENFVKTNASLVAVLDVGYAVRVYGFSSSASKSEVRYIKKVDANGFYVDRPFSEAFTTATSLWTYSSCPESTPLTGQNPQYLGNILKIQGTASVTKGSNVVTGTGTEFWLDLRIGWPFMIGENREVKYVQQITSDTSFVADSVFTYTTAAAVPLYLGTTTVFGVLPPSTTATPFLIELLPTYTITATIVVANVTYTQTRTIRNVTSDRVIIVDKPFDAPILPGNAGNMSIPGTASPMGTLTSIQTPYSSLCDSTKGNGFTAADGGCAVYTYSTPAMGKPLATGSTTGYLKTNPICYNTGRCVDLNTGSGTLTVSAITTATTEGTSTSTMTLVASSAPWTALVGTSPILTVLATLNSSASTPLTTFDTFRVTTLTDASTVTVSHSIKTANTDVYLAGAVFSTWKWFVGCPMVGPKTTFSYKSCPVNPGCCGVQIGGSVGQNLWAFYTMTPEYSTVNLRVFAYTIDDNLDMLVQANSILPTSTAYNQTSVRESNPWAIDVPQYSVARNCAPYTTTTVSGGTKTLPTADKVTAFVSEGDAAKLIYPPYDPASYPYSYTTSSVYGPNDNEYLGTYLGTASTSIPPQSAPAYGIYYNCKDWVFGLRGDNRYPQRTGSSEYSFTLYTEFNYPDFLCQSDRSYYPAAAADTGAVVSAIPTNWATGTFPTGAAANPYPPVHKDRCEKSGLRTSKRMFTVSQPKQTIGRGRRDVTTTGIFNNTAAGIDLTHPSCRGPVVVVYTIRMVTAGTAATANAAGSYGTPPTFKYRANICNGAAPTAVWSATLSATTAYATTLGLGSGISAARLADTAGTPANFGGDFGVDIIFPVTVSDSAWTVNDEFEVYVSIGSDRFASFNTPKAVRAYPGTAVKDYDVHLDDVPVYGVYTGSDTAPVTFTLTIQSVVTASNVNFTWTSTSKSFASTYPGNATIRNAPYQLGTTGIFVVFKSAVTVGGLTMDYRVGDVFTITVTAPATMRLTTGAPPQFRIGATQMVSRAAGSLSVFAMGFYTGSAPARYTIWTINPNGGSVKVTKNCAASIATATCNSATITVTAPKVQVYIGDGLYLVFEGSAAADYDAVNDKFDIPILGATNGIPAFDTPQLGAVFYKDKMHVSDGFETNFQLQFSAASMCQGRIDGICDGGNGLAFVLHNDDGAADASGNQVATAGLLTTGYGLNDFLINGTYSPCASADPSTSANPSCVDLNNVNAVNVAGTWRPDVYKYVYTLKIVRLKDASASPAIAGDRFVLKRDAHAYQYYTDFYASCPTGATGCITTSGYVGEYECTGLSTPITIIDGLTVACSTSGHTVGDQIEVWTTRQRRKAFTSNPIGCAGSGNGFGDRVDPDPPCLSGGLRKGMAVEFDVYYDQNQRDPRQGLRHWWINATEIISNQDNHLGVFLTPNPAVYPNHGLSADHSNDAFHFAATPSIPNLNDGLAHTIKLQYFNGFTTSPRQGQGLIWWSSCTDILGCVINGNPNTKFKSEMKYTDKVVTYISVNAGIDVLKLAVVNTYGDRIIDDAKMKVRWVPPGCKLQIPIPGTFCGTYTGALPSGLTSASYPTIPDALVNPPSYVTVNDPVAYSVFRDYPGYLTIFVDEMNMFALRVAIRDDEFAAVTDAKGNSYIGFTGATGYIHYTQEVLNWSFCNHLGCVPI